MKTTADVSTRYIEDIRTALRESERSGVDLAKESGVHPVNLSRFRTGTGGLGPEALGSLAAALGLELRAIRPARGKKATARQYMKKMEACLCRERSAESKR